MLVDYLHSTHSVTSLAGSVVDLLCDEDGILYTNLDLVEVVWGKFDFDVVCHYTALGS